MSQVKQEPEMSNDRSNSSQNVNTSNQHFLSDVKSRRKHQKMIKKMRMSNNKDASQTNCNMTGHTQYKLNNNTIIFKLTISIAIVICAAVFVASSSTIFDRQPTSIEFDIYSWGLDTYPMNGTHGYVLWQGYKTIDKQNRCDTDGIGVLMMNKRNIQQFECKFFVSWHGNINGNINMVQLDDLEKYLLSLKGKNKIIVIMMSNTATLENDHDDKHQNKEWNHISNNFLRPLGCDSIPKYGEPFIFVGDSDTNRSWTYCQRNERYTESISKKVNVKLIED